MVYLNDESDKSVRLKNYILTVYVLPIGIALMVGALIYYAIITNYLTMEDGIFGGVFSVTPILFLSVYNKRHWLKMPDGTHHNLKNISPTNKINLNEPTQYEAEFFLSKTEMIVPILSSIALIVMGIWFGIKKAKGIVIPIGICLMGIAMFYFGLKQFLDKNAKLKIAKNGLWTKKLGFVEWNDINYAEVVEDNRGKAPQTILEIRLKGTKYEEANKPDERLILNNLKNREDVEMIINDSISKYNERKQ